MSEYESLHSVANWRYEESRIMAPVHSKPPRRPYNYVYNLFFYNKGRLKFRYADVLTDYGRFTKSIDDLKIREGLRKIVVGWDPFWLVLIFFSYHRWLFGKSWKKWQNWHSFQEVYRLRNPFIRRWEHTYWVALHWKSLKRRYSLRLQYQGTIFLTSEDLH